MLLCLFRSNSDILSKSFRFVKYFFHLFDSVPGSSGWFPDCLYLSGSVVSAFPPQRLISYHFSFFLSTTFLIYFSIISLIFKSSSFLPIKNVPPPRLLLSSVPLLFSLLFLSDECYLITAVFNCQCFLYISCNSEYSEKLASAFPNTNSYCKLACSKLIGLGNIGRMPLTERTSVLSVVADA